MDLTINEQEGRLVISLCGDLDNMASSKAEAGIAPVFERKDCDVVFDCSQMNYISSSGLRILLNVYKHTRSNGHEAILKGLKNDVEEVFRLTGFLQLFKVEDV